MIVIPLLVALFLGPPPQSDPTQQPYKLTPEQMEQARQKYEPTRLSVVHVNDLAGNIHSEADARVLVDAVAERLTGNQHQSWTTRSIRHRVAHAEFEAVSDPLRLIPEQRVVDVWNEYVRELDAPAEALITVAELHNLRDAMYTSSQAMWKRDGLSQTFWTVPDV